MIEVGCGEPLTLCTALMETSQPPNTPTYRTCSAVRYANGLRKYARCTTLARPKEGAGKKWICEWKRKIKKTERTTPEWRIWVRSVPGLTNISSVQRARWKGKWYRRLSKHALRRTRNTEMANRRRTNVLPKEDICGGVRRPSAALSRLRSASPIPAQIKRPIGTER